MKKKIDKHAELLYVADELEALAKRMSVAGRDPLKNMVCLHMKEALLQRSRELRERCRLWVEGAEIFKGRRRKK